MSVEEERKRGGISVETEHIFPIIKKWLYSEKEIFLREIVSNACDAVTKLKRLCSLGEVTVAIDHESYRIDVKHDKEAKTLSVRDNGIGMSEEELQKYICSIALSGALDFIQKYEGESENGADNGIIGHFGLGFYSSFMVSDTVEIITKSYTDAPAVKWVCGEDGEYEISEPDEDEKALGRGTTVVMHISSDGEEYLQGYKIREILDKYCSFMPVPIYFDDGEHEDEGKNEDESEDDDKKSDEKKPEEKPINEVTPLWLKNPSDCTDEEYRDFYHKVFGDWRDPLFWIHISADYPLNFKGILYFPKLNEQYENLEGKIKLYYNQVFVADNIKEVIPEFLLMLRGVLDCPELPLNVSRSYLQNSTYVKKVSQHIVKKVADKLNGMFGNEREKYEGLWDDIKIFVEYGCIRDEKFYERVKDSILLPLTNGKYVTTDEYFGTDKSDDNEDSAAEDNAAAETGGEATGDGAGGDGGETAEEKKPEKIAYYCNDKTAEAHYIDTYVSAGIDVIYLGSVIDNQFISLLEREQNCKFARVDAGIADALKADGESAHDDKVEALFRRVSGISDLTVQFERLRDAATPTILTEGEDERRMNDMMRIYGMGEGDAPKKYTLTVNLENGLIGQISGDPDGELAEKTAKYLWSLALICQRRLTSDEMKAFISESCDILGRLYEKN
ncbi:MAG: molecular chaperone HtpG [Firmicutes bacterium]|nr:molecular chaperone HtpG [Bacillota bacterium]